MFWCCDAMLFYSFFVTRNVYLYEEKHFVIHSAKIAILKYVNVESKKNWNICHAQMMDYLGAVVFAEVHNSECCLHNEMHSRFVFQIKEFDIGGMSSVKKNWITMG